MVLLQVYIYDRVPGWVGVLLLLLLYIYLFINLFCVPVCFFVCMPALHDSFCMYVFMCFFTAGLDIGPLTDGSSFVPPSQGGRRTPRSLPEEPLDGILSPELDKMVTDGQCGRKDLDTFSVCFFFYSVILKLHTG